MTIQQDTAAGPAGALITTPFVGRAAELALLTRVLDDARTSVSGGVALLEGEAGIGKSRLAAELSLRARELGFTTVTIHLRPDEALHSPLRLQLLAALGSQTPGGSVPGGVDLMSAPLEDAASIFVASVRLACEAAPLLVAVDDIHGASKSDAELLVLLGHLTRDCRRFVLLMTCRDEAAQDTPVQSVIARLAEAQRLLRLPLRGLTPRDIGDYLEQSLGRATTPAISEAVYERTEGHPFFLTEVASLLARSPISEFEVALKRIPDSVRDVVRFRLEDLDDEAREVLTRAAVVGMEFDGQLLAVVSGCAPSEVLRALDGPIREGMLVESAPTGRYRFSHALVRETLLTRLTLAGRVQVHAATAAALEQASPPADVRALAHHYAACGVTSLAHLEKAVRYVRQAARSAERSADWDAAARWHEQAVDLVASLGFPATPQDQAADLRSAGRCWRLAGRVRIAWRLLMRAVQVAREARDWQLAAECALEALEGIDAPPAKRRRLAQDALDAGEALEPETRARLMLQLAGYEISPEATEAVERARRLVRQHRLTGVEARLADREYYEAVAVGDLASAQTLIEARLQVSIAGDNRIEEARALTRLTETVVRSGRLTEAWGRAEHMLERASREHLAGTADYARTILMSIALARCDFATFDELSSEVREGAVASQLRARRFELVGNWRHALGALPGVGTRGTDHPRIAWDLHGALARVRNAAGARLEARDHLADWIRRRRENLHPVDRQDALSVIGEALLTHGEGPLILDVLEESLTWDAVRFIPLTATGLDRLRGSIAARLGDRERAETYLRRAVDWAAREELPAEGALALAELAHVADPADTDDGCDATATARAILERFGLAPPASLAWAGEATVAVGTGAGDLSSRERQVLSLVAEGATNRQIALSLGISPFTVARHVSSVLAKLQVANRAEAVTRAFRDGILDPNSKN